MTVRIARTYLLPTYRDPAMKSLRSWIFTIVAPAILLYTGSTLAQSDGSETPTALDDPIPDEIELGDIEVNLVEFVQAPETDDEGSSVSTNNAHARIQYLQSPPDESGRLFFNDTRGILYVTDEDGSEPTIFLDLRELDVGFYPNTFPHESGLMSFAFHHEFAIEDAPGYGKFYTAFSADPTSGNADFIEEANSTQESVIYEWTAEDSSALEFSGTHRELLRVGQFRPNHNIGSIGFNPTATMAEEDEEDSGDGSAPSNTEEDLEGDGEATEPELEDWGVLYIALGDGGGAHDSRNHGQDVTSPLGAVLRIDPLGGDTDSGEKYGIPTDNPEIEGAIPELWAYGLRHPQHFSWDADGRMYLLDIGQDQVEEVNLGETGANYGWRLREGTFATAHGVDTSDDLGGVYDVEDEEEEEETYTYPVAQYDHDEGFAIGSGFVYRGEAIPELVGKYVFTELVRGRVFYIETETTTEIEGDPDDSSDTGTIETSFALTPGTPATIYELRMLIDGEEGSLTEEAGMANTYFHHSPHLTRVDLRLSVDRHGELYLLSKGDGWIRKIVAVEDDESTESE